LVSNIVFNDGDNLSQPQEIFSNEQIKSTPNGFDMTVDPDGVANLILGQEFGEVFYRRWYDGQVSEGLPISDGHIYPYAGGPSEVLILTRDNGAATAIWTDKKHQDGNYGSDEIWVCRMLD